jgi:AraC-like DNA-binding protein
MDQQSGGDSGTGHRVVPDGCMDMLFQWLPDGRIVRSSLCGAFWTPFDALPSSGSTRYFGIRFFPGGLYRLLRIPSVEFTDRLLPLEDIPGAPAFELAERLPCCSSFEERTIVAERCLLAAAKQQQPLDSDPSFGNALFDLFRSGGTMPVRELSVRGAVSERHLHRLFMRWTGIGPKSFGRIVRFQTILADMKRCSDSRCDWADTAVKFGYADQAHFIRDFKSLYGQPPEEAMRAMHGHVRNIQYERSEIIYTD